MSRVHDFALRYIAAGIPIFPVHGAPGGVCTCALRGDCLNVGKHPATRRGFHEATTDMDQVNDWYVKRPDLNIGIPTGAASGLLVVDADSVEAV